MKLSERLARKAEGNDDGAAAPTGRRSDAAARPAAGARAARASAVAESGTATTRRRGAAAPAASAPAAPAAADDDAPAPSAPRTAAARTPRTTVAPRRARRELAEVRDGLDGLRAKVRIGVVSELGPKLTAGAVDEAVVRRLLETHLTEALRSSTVTVGPTERAEFIESTLADMLGWGPLTPLMADQTVTEIMVNGLDDIWVERRGKIERTEVRFPSMSSYRTVIDRMLAVAGRRVDEAQPMADGRLPDGSRINVIIPPLVVGDPVLTVRRFPEISFTVADLVERGSLSPEAADFLSLCIEGKLNVIVSGGTGTGKTTLLNVLSTAIPQQERVITIEDSAELRLSQPHVVTLEARPANIEGVGLVSIRDLVRNALRMRPDRILVGEVRGGEALDMLQAMNTGHEGSMTTVHANTPRDALARVETMVLMSGVELPLNAIREQVASALDIIVQLARQNDGSRVVSTISEVQGREGDTITLQDVYTRAGNAKELTATGLRPRSVEKVQDRGLEVPASLFRKTVATTASVKRKS